MASPNLRLFPAATDAIAAAWGWNEPIPMPPASSNSNRIQYEGASPIIDMKVAVTAGPKTANSRLAYLSEIAPYTGCISDEDIAYSGASQNT